MLKPHILISKAWRTFFLPFSNFYEEFVLVFALFPFFSFKFRGGIINFFLTSVSLDRTRISRNVRIYGAGKLKIGDSFINENTLLDKSGELVIGDRVAVGMNCTILTATHSIGSFKRAGKTKFKKTIIEDNCWLGANVIVLPGVKIGKGSVISAGEIVRKNISKNVIFINGEEVKIKKLLNERE